MFGIGTTEALILLAVILILFGSRKLPQLGSAMGKALTNFKKGMKEDQNEDSIDQDKKDS